MIKSPADLLHDITWNASKTIDTYFYEFDILAYVISLQRTGHDNPDIFNRAISVSKPVKAPVRMLIKDVQKDDIEKAEKVRDYFKNKLLMRRLKNQEITKFMKIVDRILEHKDQLDSDCLPALVKLPIFYDETKNIEAIYEKCTSAELPEKPYDHFADNVISIDGPCECMGKVERNTLHEKHTKYFFKHLETGYLIKVQATSTIENTASWDFISKLKLVTISGAFSIVPVTHDTEFAALRPLENKFTIGVYDDR